MRKSGSDEVKNVKSAVEGKDMWCSEKRKILSFKPLRGFNKRSFEDRDEMYSYALKLAEAGYRLA